MFITKIIQSSLRGIELEFFIYLLRHWVFKKKNWKLMRQYLDVGFIYQHNINTNFRLWIDVQNHHVILETYDQ